MKQKDFMLLFKENFTEVWSEWKPERGEIRIWLDELNKYDADIIAQAAQEHYTSQAGQYKKPSLSEILKIVKRATAIRIKGRKQDLEMVLDYTVKDVESDWKMDFYAPKCKILEHLEEDRLNYSNRHRARVEALYNRKCFVTLSLVGQDSGNSYQD